MLFLGEFIPKVLFKVFADTILPVMAVPFRVLHWLLTPGVLLITGLSSLLFKIVGVKVSEHDIEFSSVDLEKFIKDHNQTDGEEEEEVDTELFENALFLKKLKVRDCMVPRREITAIDISDSVEDLKKLIIETYHSRILVYDDSIDKIVGYIHHFDLHKKPADIRSILIQIKVVPETMHIQKLLNEFIKENKSIPTSIDQVKTGDVIQIFSNELIPLDAILSKGKAEIDYSFVTGESIPQSKEIGEIIYAGGKQMGGVLELVVVKEISQS